MLNWSGYRTSLLFVAFGGLLTALAFPLQPVPYLAPVSFWPLVFIGPAPFLARLLKTENLREATIAALVFSGPWFLVAGMWIFRMFDALGWILIWLPILCIFMFAQTAHLARRAGLPVTITWPILWVAIEYLRSEWSPLRIDWLSEHLDPLNFTWYGLGHPRVAWPPAAQSADLIGGYGLSLSPFLVSLMLARFMTWKRQRVFVGFVVAFVAADAAYCYWAWTRPIQGLTVNVGVVQSERYELSVLLKLTDELLESHPNTELVVWPELSFSAKPGDQDRLHEYARRHNITMVVGVEIPQSDGGYLNRAWWLPADGASDVYAKQMRVPFVERHASSAECKTFPLRIGKSTIRVGIVICYDMDFSWPVRQIVSECGAELISMPSLDDVSWGGTQHAQHSLLPRLRAIENRRPIIEATTSGFSQIIDSRGAVLTGIPFHLYSRPDRPTTYQEGFAASEVIAHKNLSFYGRGGYLVPPALALAGGVCAVLASLLCWLARSGRGKLPDR